MKHLPSLKGRQPWGKALGTLLALLVWLGLPSCAAEPRQIIPPLSESSRSDPITPPPSTLTSITALSPTPSPPLGKIDPLGWLVGDPCMPPCWQHITPGQPLTDALQALHQFVPADLINPETFTATNEGFIVWEGSTYSAYLTYDATQLIGRQVIVTYFSDVSWEQLLESYGEPEYTLIMSNMTHELGVMAYGFGVVYLDEGLFLRSLDDRDTSLVPPAISPQMTFDEVIFFEAGLNGLRKELRLGPDEPLRKWLVPWVGFQSFEQYCQTTYPDEAEWVCP